MVKVWPQDADALAAFWRFYEPRCFELLAKVGAAAQKLPAWSDALNMNATEAAAREQRSIALQRAAFEQGQWEELRVDLRARGALYAKSGVSFASWFALIRILRDVIGAAVAEVDPPDTLAITRGMCMFIDMLAEQIGESFLVEKQRLLTQGETWFRSIFDKSPLPMWMFDRETLEFVAVNDAAIKQYGYSREEFLRMTIRDIRPAEDLPALQLDVVAAHGMTDPRTWRHRRKDGTLLEVEIVANDFSDGVRPMRLVLAKDITERVRAQQDLRRTEDQLRQAQKMDAIGRLAGGVAHDFNNMLTVITSYAAILEETLQVSDARREDASEIRRASERAAGITRQLLTMSRHGATRPRSIDLDELITSFVPMLRRLVGEQVSVVTESMPVPAVLADPGQVEQVLMNLAINARDAMPEGGRLAVATSVSSFTDEEGLPPGAKPGTYVVVAVSDTGSGMDVETQARVFDPFFTTKEDGKGTGLGLSIVHGIVSQAGGFISIYSELGHGTSFRVYLPVSDVSVPAPEIPHATAPDTLPALTVLIVDDQREVRTVAARVLQRAGCHVIEAASAEEARRICVAHDAEIDVIVTDVMLADGRGDALVEHVRELRPQISVVLMSGYPGGARGPVGTPSRELLAKPFSPAQLRMAVAQANGDRTGGAQVRAVNDARERPRVLVADDDRDVRRVVARYLRRQNLDVVEVDGGRAAVAALEAAGVDVIVSDVHMPEGGGLDLMRAVRRLDLDVPIILMSGGLDVVSAAAAIEYGAFRFLAKPLELEHLGKTVQHAVRVHSLARLRREAFTVTGAHAGAADRAGLEVRFDQALDQLWMAFQPIFDARTGLPFGVEALVRSRELSMANPQALLDAATALHRLPALGRKVRTLSAAALAGRHDQLALFVNLHPEDLHDVDLLAESAPLTQLASRVILEVTERASLGNTRELSARVERLRKLGFRLAVDDIGAGYSGLTSFTELVPEIVKIDMSLVRDIHQSALKQRTVAALCRLCRECGSLVVGEGVETAEEKDCLVALGCDLLQGYLLGRPSPTLPG